MCISLKAYHPMGEPFSSFPKAQFANCVLALCVIDEIVINSMTSGKIMEIRPPVS